VRRWWRLRSWDSRGLTRAKVHKVNPAKLLGLPSLEEIGLAPPTTASRQ